MGADPQGSAMPLGVASLGLALTSQHTLGPESRKPEQRTFWATACSLPSERLFLAEETHFLREPVPSPGPRNHALAHQLLVRLVFQQAASLSPGNTARLLGPLQPFSVHRSRDGRTPLFPRLPSLTSTAHGDGATRVSRPHRQEENANPISSSALPPRRGGPPEGGTRRMAPLQLSEGLRERVLRLSRPTRRHQAREAAEHLRRGQ